MKVLTVTHTLCEIQTHDRNVPAALDMYHNEHFFVYFNHCMEWHLATFFSVLVGMVLGFCS
jgi:hypothetical protein